MSDTIKAEIEDLLAQYHQRAILLHRPYPPTPDMSARSYLGGLPQLPADYEWPVGNIDGTPTPLHFVAQIACDELPAEQTQLPGRGTLFFFLAMTEEMLWGDSGNPNDDCRVIYCEHVPADTPVRDMPDDLPPICNEDEFSWRNDTLWRKPTDGRVYTKWPLRFYAFDNYPVSYNHDHRTQTDEFWQAYNRMQNQKTGESLMASTGIGLTEAAPSSWAKYARKPADFKLPDDIGENTFPQCGAMIEEITCGILYAAKARHARYKKALEQEDWRIKWETEKRAKELAKRNAERSLTKKIFGKKETLPPIEPREIKKPDNAAQWQSVEDACEKWLRIADKLGPSGAPDKTTRDTFKAWLGKLNAQTVQAKQGHEVPLLQTHKTLVSAMRRVVQRCAYDAKLCAVMPGQYFSDLADRHNLIVHNPDYPESKYAGPYLFERHQMLGYFPSSQDTIRVTDKEVSLLHLFSDYGMDFMFCDVGEAHIFISPEDLRAGRFDKAYAATQGG